MIGLFAVRFCWLARRSAAGLKWAIIACVTSAIQGLFFHIKLTAHDLTIGYRSASDYLRREWKFWRVTAPKYGFGRTELLPIKRTAEGVASYVAKYIAKHIGQRLPADKGARLV
jgi:hypothetical protein